MANKTDQVMRHLQERGSITSMEAIELYGATRLSAIIFNLRHRRGMKIESVMTDGRDRYGNNVTYAVYKYAKKDPLQSENSVI